MSQERRRLEPERGRIFSLQCSSTIRDTVLRLTVASREREREREEEEEVRAFSGRLDGGSLCASLQLC
jgi:hypothetical protein